jgi:hypothetical protein
VVGQSRDDALTAVQFWREAIIPARIFSTTGSSRKDVIYVKFSSFFARAHSATAERGRTERDYCPNMPAVIQEVEDDRR